MMLDLMQHLPENILLAEPDALLDVLDDHVDVYVQVADNGLEVLQNGGDQGPTVLQLCDGALQEAEDVGELALAVEDVEADDLAVVEHCQPQVEHTEGDTLEAGDVKSDVDACLGVYVRGPPFVYTAQVGHQTQLGLRVAGPQLVEGPGQT